MGKNGIFFGKKKDITWGEINMFLLEGLLNSVQEIWTSSGEEKAEKGQGGKESDWNCPLSV